jgi:hypothetical protein
MELLKHLWNKLLVHAESGWSYWKPNTFKREFSVAGNRCIYKEGRELEIIRGIKNAMRKMGAGLGTD